MTTATYMVEMFGGLRVSIDGQVFTRFRTQKTGALLAYLALFLKRQHPREELADIFWPDVEPEAGRTNLRTALSSIRRQLEPPGTEVELLVADRQYVRLDTAVITSDVAEFEALAAAAQREEDPAQRAELYCRAVELYKGPLLPGSYEDWAVRERDRLQVLFLRVLREAGGTLEQCGDRARAIDFLHKALGLDPLAEETHCELMRLYAATGQMSSVSRQYHQLDRLLLDELGVRPSAATRDLRDRLLRERPTVAAGAAVPALAERAEEPPVYAVVSGPPPRPAATAPRLPLHLTRFVGRSEEIAHLTQLLRLGGERLVTLTGTGGVGKTRLAGEMARLLLDDYARAVWFVPLADVADPARLTTVIASALRLTVPQSGDALEEVIGMLRRQQSLLILDNLEQVLDEGARVVMELLAHADGLTVLATSRQRLDIGGEVEFPVPPLQVPTMPGAPEQLARYSSVQLFVTRAQAVRPDFQVTRANAAPLAALCERLEGIPLAVELAAAWAQTLTPSQILARLDNRLDLLASRRKDLAPRHRTLRDTMEWSYRLLSERAQRFFARLSVFRGGWTLEAAEAICGEPDTLGMLQTLRERSLVNAGEAGEQMRYSLLESLREFAAERLDDAEAEGTADKHLHYYLSLATTARGHLDGPEQAAWLERLEDEHDNFRSALAWSLGREDKATVGLELAQQLHFFWVVRGHLREGFEWLCRLLDATEETFQTGSRLLAEVKRRVLAIQGAAELAFSLGDLPDAWALFEQSVPLAESCGYTSGMAYSANYLGVVASQRGELRAAQAFAMEGLRHWRELGDEGGMAHSLSVLGSIALARGDTAAAAERLEDGLRLYRALGNPRGANMVREYMEQLLLARGDSRAAGELAEEHLRDAREIGDMVHIQLALSAQGEAARVDGDLARAAACLEEGLRVAREIGSKKAAVGALARLAEVRADQGAAQAACSLLRDAVALAGEARDLQAQADARRLLARLLYRYDDLEAATAVCRQTVADDLLHGPAHLLADIETMAMVLAERGEPSSRQEALTLLNSACALRGALELPLAARPARDLELLSARLRTELPEEAVAAAGRAGASLSLESAIERGFAALALMPVTR